MKYFFALVLLLALPAASAHAQASMRNNPNRAGKGFRSNGAENSGIGVKGGVSLNQIVGAGASMYDKRGWYTAFHAGIYSQIGITNKFSVQPEILYQRRGFKGALTYLNQQDADSSGEAQTVKLNYVSVPVLLVFNVFKNVALQLGPQVSYLFSVNQGDGQGQVDAKVYRYNSLDVGVVGGIEAKLEFLRIGARYDYSLRDLRKDTEDGFTVAGKSFGRVRSNITNSTIQVYVGIGL